MYLSETFAGISRIFRNLETFGKEGYKLWKGKLSEKDEVIGYNLKGIKHTLFLRSNTSDHSVFGQIFIDKQYEYPIDFIPETIIDCGANIGLTSVYYANRYPQARIIAVEPESSNFDLLKMNTKDYPNITCLKKGIWDKETNLEIIDNGEGKWAFVTKEVVSQNENTISAVSINDIIKQFSFNRIDIVKIDIEGSEKQVFSKNYEPWLSQTKLVIVELHDKMQHGTSHAFFDAMQHYDYRMDIKGENIFCEILHEK